MDEHSEDEFSGMPEGAPEADPLGVPEAEPDSEVAEDRDEESLPGIAADGEPPSSG